jgi:hypothetical protein
MTLDSDGPDGGSVAPATEEDSHFVGRRFSWSTVFAGAAVASAIQIVLLLLGFSVGIAASDLSRTPDWGASLWLIGASGTALFFGCLVAGRFAGQARRLDGVVQGLVTWALVTLLTFHLGTTMLGRVLDNTTHLAGEAAKPLILGAVAAELAGAIEPRAAVAILEERTALTGEEAERMVQALEEQSRRREEELGQLAASVRSLANTTSNVALSVFAAALFGAIAAVLGAILGLPSERRT